MEGLIHYVSHSPGFHQAKYDSASLCSAVFFVESVLTKHLPNTHASRSMASSALSRCTEGFRGIDLLHCHHQQNHRRLCQ